MSLFNVAKIYAENLLIKASAASKDKINCPILDNQTYWLNYELPSISIDDESGTITVLSNQLLEVSDITVGLKVGSQYTQSDPITIKIVEEIGLPPSAPYFDTEPQTDFLFKSNGSAQYYSFPTIFDANNEDSHSIKFENLPAWVTYEESAKKLAFNL